MKSSHVKFKRAPETAFLIVDSIIFDKFSPYALKVYGQLRKLTNYTTECDDAEITVKALAQLSGMSERKVYTVLNELEKEHYVIKRTNWDNFRYGKTNSFLVSQTYNYFKSEQIEQTLNTPAQYAEAVDNPVQHSYTPAQYAEGTAQYADLILQESFQEKTKLTNCKTSSSSFIFSQTLDKSILLQKLPIDNRSDEEFLNQVKDHVDNHSNKSFARMQRAQGALRLLKKLKDQNIIFYVAGSQPNEEEQSKQPKLIETDAQRNERQYFTYELIKEKENKEYISKDLQKYPGMREKYSQYAR